MEIKLEERLKRLDRFYGDVQRSQNESILSLITGKNVLDVGCGYGALVKQLTDTNKFRYVMGIDNELESVSAVHKLYKGIDVKKMSIYEMNFLDNQFETVIFRESIHHLDIDKALSAAKRVCSKEIIIFDPNPNLIVKLSRYLINHKDERVSINVLAEAFNKHNLKIENIKYRDVFAFPFSGGFVGIEICPNIELLKKLLIFIDKGLNMILKILGLQKYFCWRYLIKIRVNKDVG